MTTFMLVAAGFTLGVAATIWAVWPQLPKRCYRGDEYDARH